LSTGWVWAKAVSVNAVSAITKEKCFIGIMGLFSESAIIAQPGRKKPADYQCLCGLCAVCGLRRKALPKQRLSGLIF
jgi:hypothetical protein